MKKAIVYTREKYCPYCESAKKLLNEMQIPYEEIVVNSEEVKLNLMNRIGHTVKTVPQIFLIDENDKEEYVGGYDDLNKRITK